MPSPGGGVLLETEPNGGGDCAQANQLVAIGGRIFSTIDNPSGCNTDEYHLVMDTTKFYTAADTLWFNLPNASVSGGAFGGANLGDMSDHFIYQIWYQPTTGAGRAIGAQTLGYQTFTKYANMPSGRGAMNYVDFKPNGAPTCLCTDQDQMLFFYDLDQNFNTPTIGRRNVSLYNYCCT